MDSRLETTVNGLRFVNPFVIGSGPPSTNARVISKAFAAGWGGAVAKTTSLTDTEVVNVVPRYGKLRSPSGDVIGFENIELISDRPFEDWEVDFATVKANWPDRILIASIMESHDQGRWQELASRCAAVGVDALELNFSCPHGHPEKGMGAAMGQDPVAVAEVTGWVSDAVDIPVWAKMTPNITDIREPARAAIGAGADGITAINTILGIIGIDLKTLKPFPTVEGHTTPGGYSALAVKPIGLRMVNEISQVAGSASISGVGGVMKSHDAIEYMLLGAHTVQVCTGAMLQGMEMVKELQAGVCAFLEQHGFGSVQEIVGKSCPFVTSHHHLVSLQAQAKAEKTAARASCDQTWGDDCIKAQTAGYTSNE